LESSSQYQQNPAEDLRLIWYYAVSFGKSLPTFRTTVVLQGLCCSVIALDLWWSHYDPAKRFTQRSIPEDLNLQQYDFENIIPR